MFHPTTLPSSLSHFRAAEILEQVRLPTHWPECGDLMVACYKMGPGEAALIMIVGVLVLLFGVNMYKAVVTLNLTVVGAGLGGLIGERGGNAGVGALLGAVVVAMVCIPMMKHATVLIGVVVGTALGVTLWKIFELNPEFMWAGGFCGAVTFGFMSLQFARGCIMVFTALQGSFMTVVGVLGLVMKYQDLAPRCNQFLSTRQYVLPLAIFIPALCGVVFQQTPGGVGVAARNLRRRSEPGRREKPREQAPRAFVAHSALLYA